VLAQGLFEPGAYLPPLFAGALALAGPAKAGVRLCVLWRVPAKKSVTLTIVANDLGWCDTVPII
jgi:hypothetical protein